MAKKKFTWKDWWKESLKSLPLILCCFIALFVFGIWAFILTAIIVVYIGGLYDKEWQKKIKQKS